MKIPFIFSIKRIYYQNNSDKVIGKVVMELRVSSKKEDPAQNDVDSEQIHEAICIIIMTLILQSINLKMMENELDLRGRLPHWFQWSFDFFLLSLGSWKTKEYKMNLM